MTLLRVLENIGYLLTFGITDLRMAAGIAPEAVRKIAE
jgi:hypothetical protein